MPTRDARGLSKTGSAIRAHAGARPALSPRPPEPALPSRRRWALSIALAVGLPLLLGWAAQRLGPGPHAPVRIELALQPFGTPGGRIGVAANPAGRSGTASPAAHAAGGPAQGAPPAGNTRNPSLVPTPPASEPPAPATAAALPASPVNPPANPFPAAEVVASAATARISPEPQHTASASAFASKARAVLASLPFPHGAASTPSGPAASELPGAVSSAPGRPGAVSSAPARPGAAQGESGAPGGGGTGVPGSRSTDEGIAAGGNVGPEALDGGFGLAAPVRVPYPSEALARGQAGRARIELEIEPSGRVARVTVLEETAGWGFGDAARQGYSGARFTPPTVQSRPVRVLLRKTIEFWP